VKVLLLGIFPRNGEEIATRIRAVNAITSQFADGSSVFYLDMAPQFENGLGVVKPELYTDGLHLTAAGYKV
jgi:lysophospholipase L1-like esterase